MKNQIKSTLPVLLLATFSALISNGCVAIPPLVNVEHKHNPPSNNNTDQRLNAIEQRLSNIEQKISQK